MKSLRVLLISAVLFLALTDSHAQTSPDPQPLSQFPFVTNIPPSGTFWLYSMYGLYGADQWGPPIPWNPWSTNVNVYMFTNEFLGDIQYVIDDRPIVQAQAAASAATGAERSSGLTSSMEERGSDDGGGSFSSADYASMSNVLWLEVTDTSRITNGWLGVMIHGTQPQIACDLQYVLDVPNANAGNWTLDQTVTGADNSDSTFTWVSITGRTNLLLRAVSWIDSAGQGLPDWWCLKYFGTTNVDPWGDPDGDGLSNIEEFYAGANPLMFNTPPAPVPFLAAFSPDQTTVTLTWHAPPGPVLNYVLERSDFNWSTWSNDPYNQIATPSAGATTYTDSGITSTNYLIMFDDPYTYNPFGSKYRIHAVYAAGNSQTVETAIDAGDSSLAMDAYLVPNETGRWELVCPHIPTKVTSIRLEWTDWDYWYLVGGSDYPPQTISVTNFVNGRYVFPDTEITNHLYWGSGQVTLLGDFLWVRGLDVSGNVGQPVNAGPLYQDNAPYFVDGRQHMKQFLAFELRAATETNTITLMDSSYDLGAFQLPKDTNYVEFGFLHYSIQYRGSWEPGDPFYPTFIRRDNLWPFYQNYGFHYALYDTNNVSPFQWVPDFQSVPAPAVLGVQPYWLYRDSGNLSDIAAGRSSTSLSQGNGVNFYGLPFTAAHVGIYRAPNYTQFDEYDIPPGSSVPIGEYDWLVFFLSATADPGFHTLGYYFTPVLTPGDDIPLWHPTADEQPFPLPCMPGFAASNQSPLMIASLGQSVTIGGWAKMELTNSTLGKLAYLGQYFDHAYGLATNGTLMTNEIMGILSPYGEFLPTQAGPAALVTMPDPDPPYDRGTGIVQVISLTTDVNHDGTIDTNFFGPDFTSPHRPFRFWVNDDNDSGDTGGNDIPGFPVANKGSMNGTNWFVDGVRDLVDFFPVYLNIQSALKALGTNSGQPITVWLKHADGALNFVYPNGYTNSTFTPTNCLAYLRDTNIARSITTSNSLNFQTYQITAAGYPLFPSTFIDYIREHGNAMLLIEARAPTTAPLVLEIHKGTNVVAQTSLYLSITSVEQMFRQKNLIRETFSGSQMGYADRLSDADVPNEPDTNDKNFVFLHGYNVNPDQARGTFAETFKRMYWSGSHAKFYGVTWRGSESQIGDGLTPNYHTNVANAFLTAPHLAAFLNSLTNGPTTISAHSLGNMVVLSALSDFYTSVSNYFMLDAAVATEAIDGGDTPIFNMTHSTWVSPEDYSTNLYASYWWKSFPTSDARSMLGWSDRFANALSTNLYNFYSSGEEVLRDYNNDPPLDVFGIQSLVSYWKTHGPVSSFVWVWQEKGKGVSPINTVLGSTHGGWKFNTNAPYMTNNGAWHMPNSQASALSASQLQTNAFFDMNYDAPLFSPTIGSNYAAAFRNRILADAIPAMSWAIGSHNLFSIEKPGDPHNFNMQDLFQNGWPAERLADAQEFNKWWHSDFRAVAYTYTYKLFNKFVELGELK